MPKPVTRAKVRISRVPLPSIPARAEMTNGMARVPARESRRVLRRFWDSLIFRIDDSFDPSHPDHIHRFRRPLPVADELGVRRVRQNAAEPFVALTELLREKCFRSDVCGERLLELLRPHFMRVYAGCQAVHDGSIFRQYGS